MKKQLLFRRFPAVLLALLTVLMLALLPACSGMTTRPMGEDDPLVQETARCWLRMAPILRQRRWQNTCIFMAICHRTI